MIKTLRSVQKSERLGIKQDPLHLPLEVFIINSSSSRSNGTCGRRTTKDLKIHWRKIDFLSLNSTKIRIFVGTFTYMFNIYICPFLTFFCPFLSLTKQTHKSYTYFKIWKETKDDYNIDIHYYHEIYPTNICFILLSSMWIADGRDTC